MGHPARAALVTKGPHRARRAADVLFRPEAVSASQVTATRMPCPTHGCDICDAWTTSGLCTVHCAQHTHALTYARTRARKHTSPAPPHIPCVPLAEPRKHFRSAVAPSAPRPHVFPRGLCSPEISFDPVSPPVITNASVRRAKMPDGGRSKVAFRTRNTSVLYEFASACCCPRLRWFCVLPDIS